MKSHLLKLLMGLSAALLLSGAAAAADRVVGTVNVDVLNVRSSPAMTASVVGKVYIGEQVLILEEQSEWYKIRFNTGEMFVKSQYVDLMAAEEFEVSAGTVTGKVVNIRDSASLGGKVVGKFNQNTKVTINSVEGDWFNVTAGTVSGYMHSDYVLIQGQGVVSVASLSAPVPAGQTGVNAQELLDFAYQYLGVKYKYGGDSPSEGFDCSGFTMFVFNNFGISLSHSATTQATEGTPIAKTDLIPGDLVFFKTGGTAIGHVGIYVGDNNFIHATVPGDVVKVESLGSTYYTKNYVSATRVL